MPSNVDRIIARIKRFSGGELSDIVRDASLEAARVYFNAIQSAAERIPMSDKERPNWIHLADSITIYQRKRKDVKGIGPSNAFLIGPKKKAPHGFWLERGRGYRSGPYVIKPRKKRVLHWIGKDGKHYFRMSATIQPKGGIPWLEPAAKSVDRAALDAYKKKFEAEMARRVKSNG
jgi:hypothetical protein